MTIPRQQPTAERRTAQRTALEWLSGADVSIMHSPSESSVPSDRFDYMPRTHRRLSERIDGESVARCLSGLGYRAIWTQIAAILEIFPSKLQ